ncbi:MAG: response regulator transcription factor [Myxococcota bacterium]
MGSRVGSLIRILVADDHAVLRAGLRSFLGAQPDMDVIAEAADGTEVVAKAAQLRPDVVLLDLSMPKLCGLQAISQIRAASEETRVLVLTMYDNQEYMRSSLAAGSSGYLVKSADDSELLAAIRAVHQGRSYVDVSLGEGGLPSVFLSGGADAPLLQMLSNRERQVLEFVALGHTNREVAGLLRVSVKTVETYRGRVLDKLGLRSRAELVRYAIEVGIFERPSV